MKKYVAYYNRKTRKLEKIYIKNTYYRCGFFSFVFPSSDYTGHLCLLREEKGFADASVLH